MKAFLLAVLTWVALVATAHGEEISGKLDRVPWPGDYWALVYCRLSFGQYSQGLAPFEKYDNYVLATRGSIPGAAIREADPANGHNGNLPSWTGHCNGWAAAALLEPEPPSSLLVKLDRPTELRRLRYPDQLQVPSGASRDVAGAYVSASASPATSIDLCSTDMKGMLTEIYCSVRSDFWGTRYNGPTPADPNDLAYQDIKPHMLHELLIKHLKEKGEGLVFDADSGSSVWNQPVFAFKSSWVQKDKELAVTTTVTWALETYNGDNRVGLVNQVHHTYTYTMARDDSGVIVDSSWTGESVKDHPDFVWLPYAVIDEQNVPKLSLKIVKEMMGKGIANTSGLHPSPARSGPTAASSSPTIEPTIPPSTVESPPTTAEPISLLGVRGPGLERP